MNIVAIKVTQVTLPDGTKAWFEKKETAERICKIVDMLSDIALEARADCLDAHKLEAKKRKSKNVGSFNVLRRGSESKGNVEK